ncbi:heparinase II/III family protein [Breznakiella homolactica]|uniref:Heparinase II/III family protein n=1 Tax=Breznakiella homolactica TaxID=2798577 RepID=A0A7T8BBR1_9SPIR|nr:heparinase II/III family protein [Breznakiella homolactica]QQO10847.1 heparinase II/III-family protein [Breznakiella homolactica]
MIPDAAVLLKGLRAGTDRGCSGSKLFRELAGDNAKDGILNNPSLAESLGLLTDAQDRLAGSAIPDLPFSLFSLYRRNGSRLAYEDRYFERRRRLLVSGLSVWLWERPGDVTALEDILWAICDEYTWSLPAHLDDALPGFGSGTILRDGIAVGGTRDDSLVLDLFACETGFALAECCAMTEHLLDRELILRVRDTVRRRIIESYITHGGFQKWELMDNNWCAVCAGSIAGTALYLVEDDALLGGILFKLMPALDRFLGSFSPDGACLEGLSYWTYGVEFYTAAADLLFRRTAGSVDLMDDPRLPAIARFQQYCYFPGGATVAFSDGGGRDVYRTGLGCFLARRFSGVTLPPEQYGMGILGDHCHRFAPALRDLLWTGGTPEKTGGSWCTVFPEAQWMLCSGAGDTGFAAKGGFNDEPHNHNDTGSFIFYRKGSMLLCDLGAGEYTKEYFGPERYGFLCTASRGHNLPIIGGQGQKAGGEFRCGDFEYDGEGGLSMDLAPAYGIPAFRRLGRRFRFDPSAGSVLLRDTFVFDGPSLAVTERFITLVPPAVLGSTVRIESNGAECTLSSGDGTEPSVAAEVYRDHSGNPVTVYFTDFSFNSPDREFSCSFTIE